MRGNLARSDSATMKPSAASPRNSSASLSGPAFSSWAWEEGVRARSGRAGSLNRWPSRSCRPARSSLFMSGSRRRGRLGRAGRLRGGRAGVGRGPLGVLLDPAQQVLPLLLLLVRLQPLPLLVVDLRELQVGVDLQAREGALLVGPLEIGF